MKRKHKRRIKKLIKENSIYKIYNTKWNMFKESGCNRKLSRFGKCWTKLGDVKKAYNLIDAQERDEYIIVKISAKVSDLEKIDY